MRKSERLRARAHTHTHTHTHTERVGTPVCTCIAVCVHPYDPAIRGGDKGVVVGAGGV